MGHVSAAHPLRTVRRWQAECRHQLGRSVTRFPGLLDLRLRWQARPLCTELAKVAPVLTRLSDEVEQRFLACGASLQEQVRLTGQLVAQSRRLNQLTAGDAAVQHVDRFLATHLRLSDGLATEVEGLAATLDRYADHLRHLLGDQQQLERSFAPMRVLHSLFRIESAALTVEQQAQFHAVTSEMDRLHTDVAANFAVHAEALENTRQRVLAAATELHTQAAQLRAGAQEKRASVERTLDHLRTQFDQTRQRNQRLESAIVALNRETDSITVGLQYQDITRQKIEHVTSAAGEILAQISARQSTPLSRRARVQQVLCQVQAAQLGSVQEELELATGSIATGLRALLDHLQQIERECLSVASLREITSEMDAAADELREIHAVTTQLVTDALAGLSTAIKIAHGFAVATTGATDTMRRLAADLLLMGLNAQVQALQAKNNCLEVLSSEASSISSEAGALTLSFEAKLAATTETLTTFVQRSEASHRQTRAQHAELAGQHAAVLADFVQEHGATKSLVAEVGALLQELASQTDALLSSVDLADFSREPLADARQVFTSLANLLGAAAPDASEHDAVALTALQDRYTMNSERAAHAAVVAHAAGAAAIESRFGAAPHDPVPATSAVQPHAPDHSRPGTDALGDNVELF